MASKINKVLPLPDFSFTKWDEFRANETARPGERDNIVPSFTQLHPRMPKMPIEHPAWAGPQAKPFRADMETGGAEFQELKRQLAVEANEEKREATRLTRREQEIQEEAKERVQAEQARLAERIEQLWQMRDFRDALIEHARFRDLARLARIADEGRQQAAERITGREAAIEGGMPQSLSSPQSPIGETVTKLDESLLREAQTGHEFGFEAFRELGRLLAAHHAQAMLHTQGYAPYPGAQDDADANSQSVEAITGSLTRKL